VGWAPPGVPAWQPSFHGPRQAQIVDHTPPGIATSPTGRRRNKFVVVRLRLLRP